MPTAAHPPQEICLYPCYQVLVNGMFRFPLYPIPSELLAKSRSFPVSNPSLPPPKHHRKRAKEKEKKDTQKEGKWVNRYSQTLPPSRPLPLPPDHPQAKPAKPSTLEEHFLSISTETHTFSMRKRGRTHVQSAPQGNFVIFPSQAYGRNLLNPLQPILPDQKVQGRKAYNLSSAGVGMALLQSLRPAETCTHHASLRQVDIQSKRPVSRPTPHNPIFLQHWNWHTDEHYLRSKGRWPKANVPSKSNTEERRYTRSGSAPCEKVRDKVRTQPREVRSALRRGSDRRG